MEYRNLGKSGLKVSELSYGSYLTFGDKIGINEARKCIQKAFETGVNFFDNAEVYSDGMSEIIMGNILKDFRRDEFVVSTKIFWGGQKPNQTGLSRKHLIEGTKNSLKRMQLEYIDLLFCHRPDLDTPIEETVFTMDYIIRSGLAFYWGTSLWPVQDIEKAFKVAERYNCIPPTMEQSMYNMFERNRMENDLRPVFEQFGIGATTFQPLFHGLLTGKYNRGLPPQSRLALNPGLKKYLKDSNLYNSNMFKKIDMLQQLALKLEITTAQLSLAWLLRKPNVSTVIFGASNVEQLIENVKTVEIKEKITDDILRKIQEILISEEIGSDA